MVASITYAAAGAATIDTIVEPPGGGTDTIVASVSVTLPNNIRESTLLDTAHTNEDDNENLNGTGNSLPNVMIGNAGNNIIDGAGGADTMSGGGGDHSYVVDNIGDSILENLDEGTDRPELCHLHAGSQRRKPYAYRKREHQWRRKRSRQHPDRQRGHERAERW